jgi:hypothetical protein
MKKTQNKTKQSKAKSNTSDTLSATSCKMQRKNFCLGSWKLHTPIWENSSNSSTNADRCSWRSCKFLQTISTRRKPHVPFKPRVGIVRHREFPEQIRVYMQMIRRQICRSKNPEIFCVCGDQQFLGPAAKCRQQGWGNKKACWWERDLDPKL